MLTKSVRIFVSAEIYYFRERIRCNDCKKSKFAFVFANVERPDMKSVNQQVHFLLFSACRRFLDSHKLTFIVFVCVHVLRKNQNKLKNCSTNICVIRTITVTCDFTTGSPEICRVCFLYFCWKVEWKHANTLHGRSVTEIWGRDEIKNMDLWGGGGAKRRILTF